MAATELLDVFRLVKLRVARLSLVSSSVDIESPRR